MLRDTNPPAGSMMLYPVVVNDPHVPRVCIPATGG